MLVCRSAWRRLAPLTQRASTALLRNAPARPMSASSVPGSSGGNLPYYLFVGVSFVAGGFYVYHVLGRDKARLHERHEYIETELKPQLNSLKEDSVTVETNKVFATIEEPVEAAIEEAAAEEVTEQDVVLSTFVEQKQLVAEEEVSPSPSEEEPAVSVAVSTEQVEQENTEPVVEAIVVESVPVLEESSADIVEELASGAEEDWSELSARKPEESVEENSPAAEESEQAVESEAAASS